MKTLEDLSELAKQNPEESEIEIPLDDFMNLWLNLSEERFKRICREDEQKPYIIMGRTRIVSDI